MTIGRCRCMYNDDSVWCSGFFHNPAVGGKVNNKKSLGDHVIDLVIAKPSIFFSFPVFYCLFLKTAQQINV